MSAERLREAAALMRERASVARAGRWFADGGEVLANWKSDPRYIGVCDGSLPEGNVLNATHIASWHPAVALAVAEWLDGVAGRVEAKIAHGAVEKAVWSHEIQALAVADAYLGTTDA